MINPNAHSERASAALQKLIEVDPALGTLSLWCKHRDATPEMGLMLVQTEDDRFEVVTAEFEIAPAYTDGRTIFYGSAFAKWTLDQQVAVCAHEIMHIAFRHIPRAHKLAERFGKRYSNRLFNIATDALINESLAQSDYDLPEPRVVLSEVLDLIGSKQTPVEALAKLDAECLYSQLLETAENGGAQAKRIFILAERVHGDVFRGEPLGAEEALEAAEWDQRLHRALAAGAAAGRGIGAKTTQIADIPKSFTPWEVILRRMISRAVTFKPRYSFEAPTRRWLALEAEALRTGGPVPGYELSIRKTVHKRGRVAVCVDVSGSISKPMLARFAGEIDAISRRLGAEIVLIIFDDGIQLAQQLHHQDLKAELKALQFKSGGGTSFVEPIEEAIRHQPSIIVVLTDLLGPFGKQPDRIPVIWASNGGTDTKAPFGRTIHLRR